MTTAPTKMCKGCAMEIPEAARVCPHCRTRYRSRVERIGVVILAVIAGLVIGGIVANSVTSSAERDADKKIDEILGR